MIRKSPWARLDDKLHSHPKIDALGRDILPAIGLHSLAISWCSSYLTDGFIPVTTLQHLSRNGDVTPLTDALVAAGMWERAEGGFQIHDYLDYNPSKKEVLKKRRKTAERVQKFRDRCNADVTEVGNAPVTLPPARTRPSSFSFPPGFVLFWEKYPRKVDKQKALLEWKKLNPDEETTRAILEGVERWKASPEWQEVRSIVWPERFLKYRRWESEAGGTASPLGKAGAATMAAGARLMERMGIKGGADGS